jgi:hypothetical protein
MRCAIVNGEDVLIRGAGSWQSTGELALNLQLSSTTATHSSPQHPYLRTYSILRRGIPELTPEPPIVRSAPWLPPPEADVSNAKQRGKLTKAEVA